MNLEYEKVVDALKDNVVIIEGETENTVETEDVAEPDVEE